MILTSTLAAQNSLIAASPETSHHCIISPIWVDHSCRYVAIACSVTMESVLCVCVLTKRVRRLNVTVIAVCP